MLRYLRACRSHPVRRNALQDLSLASGPAEIQGRAFDLLRANALFRTRPLGAEWWLRVRDYLLLSR